MKAMLEKIDYSNPENKHKMNKLFIELMDSSKEYNKEMYDYAKMELHEIVYGKTLSEECSYNWVNSMKPVGEHWDIEETTNAMNNMGYSFNPNEFYVAANMMYNDYFNLVKDDEELAIKMAYDWLSDVDATEHKLYEYWKHIAKRD